MDRVHLSGSIWTFELRSWLCDAPALGARVEFVDVGDAERTLRWLLFEDPLARRSVAMMLGEFGRLDGQHELIERAAELLERGLLSLHRHVEIVASESRTREYRPTIEPPPPVEIAEADTWLFWDEHVSDHGLLLEAEHDELSFVLGAEEGPTDGFVVDAVLEPGEDLTIDAEVEPGESWTIDDSRADFAKQT